MIPYGTGTPMPIDSGNFNPASFGEFHYADLSVDADSGVISCFYELRGSQTTVPFEEHWRVPVGENGAADAREFEALARLLYLSVGLSYYKAAAPERICIPGTWAENEVDFLEKLIEKGLAEFAARNELPLPLRVTVDVDQVAPTQEGRTPSTLAEGQVVLTPVGGGKDSCVAIESLRAAGYEQILFAVGDFDPIRNVAARAGLPLITAQRQLDPRLLAINSDGALNGHVPVTAMNSVAACLSALSVGAAAVAMANEKSASIATRQIDGVSVNHQWSKSLEFEGLLRGSLTAGAVPVDYFSILRPYSEHRIAREFAKLRRYHDVFVSCGSAFKANARRRAQWCGRCDKCRFVALVLSPFLDIDYVEAVVGNSAASDSDVAGWADLLGMGQARPYDCIGTEEESRLSMVSARASWQRNPAFNSLASQLRDWQLTPKEAEEVMDAGEIHFCPPGLEAVLDANR